MESLQSPASVGLPQFKRPRSFETARWWLTAVVLVGIVGWGLLGRTSWERLRSAAHSPGLLASVHAAWDLRCASCHDESAAGPGAPVSDRACTACHAGPTH